MKHSKLFIFAIMTTLAVSGCKHQAATYPTDTLTTKNGSQLTITFFKHASLAIETEGRHIYIDPISQYADYASLPKADLILITHSHYDHLDSAAVAALSTAATTVVCDRTSSETLGGKCLTMKPGDTLARATTSRSKLFRPTTPPKTVSNSTPAKERIAVTS